ncbi:hypothetical protein BGX31_009457 [Mortierella sp. GBA43]|nr:hypothetical protein BGX31_009457 [Mortierella sp. GBA43]
MVVTSHASQTGLFAGGADENAKILRLIALHLQDDRQTLHACLLVSHDWSKAAVQFLYKAEHMMGHLNGTRPADPSSDLAIPLSSLEELSLEDQPRDSTQLEPSELSFGSIEQPISHPWDNGRQAHSKHLAQWQLRTTLDASLLHDDSCSYDYVSYLDKISCPWFESLIHDWGAFCANWRGFPSPFEIESSSHHEASFNRLVCELSRRCTSVDAFLATAMVHVDTLIYAMRHFKNLTWMDLKDSPELNDEVFEAVANNVRTLSYLRLPGDKMQDVSTTAVARVVLAQNTNTLSQFKVMHGTNIFEDDAILKAVGERHGHSMQRLTLAICDLEHSGLGEYGPLCSGLVSLNLEYASGVTDDVIRPILDSCRQLTKLDLTETDCTHATIQALSTPSDSTEPQPKRFGAMKRLTLNSIDAPFTTNLFLPLADACPNIEELHMNSILADSYQDFSLFIAKMGQLQDLDIGNSFPEFTDNNLISLVDALPNLRWLSIANTHITDVSLIYLAEKARNLCDLCILGCDQVTKPGLMEFLDKMVNKRGFKRLDITYCRLEDGAVAEIRERAKAIASEYGATEAVEVEGDDQFADSQSEVDEGEREDGDEQTDDDMDMDEDMDEDSEGSIDAIESLDAVSQESLNDGL